MQNAEDYWKVVYDAYAKTKEDGSLPPAISPEKWMCKYCDYFSGIRQCKKCKTIEDVDLLINPEPEVEEETTTDVEVA
jgi:hypothetical protein